MGFFSGRKSDRSSQPAPGSAEAGPDGQTGEPFKGYDRVDIVKLNASLHGYSQAQLDTIDDYERAHQNREEVLNKLRYMRGAQPLEGYDEMTPDQIIASLDGANVTTIKNIRDYERKFANRKEVVDAVAAAKTADRAARPVEKPPAYQAGGGSHDSL
jgi:hypothetical protein